MNVPFMQLWASLGLPAPVAEYRFSSGRRWRFDFAWPDKLVAVEFDGGQWSPYGGRHNRDSDREKMIPAAAAGWRVLRFSNQQWEKDPYGCMTLVAQELGATAPLRI